MDNGALTREYESGSTGHRGGSGVFPIFFREAIRNEIKSLEVGRPVFDHVEMVKIIIPGDNHTAPVRLVKDTDKEVFAEAYRRFKNEEEQVFDGTPVDSWNRLDLKQVYSLKAMGFFTVESIADCSDANLSKIGMGAMMLRDQAKAYIEGSKSNGVPERLVAENAQLRSQMDSQAGTINDLKLMVEKLMRDKGADVTTVAPALEGVLATAREANGGAGDLPVGWRELKTKEAIELCKALDFPINPRNRDEAISLLAEYQGRRDALKSSK